MGWAVCVLCNAFGFVLCNFPLLFFRDVIDCRVDVKCGASSHLGNASQISVNLLFITNCIFILCTGNTLDHTSLIYFVHEFSKARSIRTEG